MKKVDFNFPVEAPDQPEETKNKRTFSNSLISFIVPIVLFSFFLSAPSVFIPIFIAIIVVALLIAKSSKGNPVKTKAKQYTVADFHSDSQKVDASYGFQEAYERALQFGKVLDPWDLPPEINFWDLK